MKKILLAVLLLGICSACYADLYMIVDKSTQAVFTISEKDDTIVPAGKELIVLPGNWDNYGFTESPTNYTYKNNKFIKDLDKIEKQEKDKKAKEEKDAELKVIEARMRKIAIDQLRAEGVSFKHY